jgi:hypothetical protein
MSCEQEFDAFVACIATAMLSCEGGSTTAPGCLGSEQAVSACLQLNQQGAAGGP